MSSFRFDVDADCGVLPALEWNGANHQSPAHARSDGESLAIPTLGVFPDDPHFSSSHENNHQEELDSLLSALSFFPMMISKAQAGPIVPLDHYSLSYDLGGTDCTFTSDAQCQATASGPAAECYGKTIRDD